MEKVRSVCVYSVLSKKNIAVRCAVIAAPPTDFLENGPVNQTNPHGVDAQNSKRAYSTVNWAINDRPILQF